MSCARCIFSETCKKRISLYPDSRISTTWDNVHLRTGLGFMRNVGFRPGWNSQCVQAAEKNTFLYLVFRILYEDCVKKINFYFRFFRLDGQLQSFFDSADNCLWDYLFDDAIYAITRCMSLIKMLQKKGLFVIWFYVHMFAIDVLGNFWQSSTILGRKNSTRNSIRPALALFCTGILTVCICVKGTSKEEYWDSRAWSLSVLVAGKIC